MPLLSRLENRFGRFAVPNLTILFIAGQAIVFLAEMMPAQGPQVPLLQKIAFYPDKIAEGEVWRLFSWMFYPSSSYLILLLFAWYLFYLMGTTLESVWGTFRYNCFLMIGYLATVLSTFGLWLLFGTSGEAVPNSFLYGSVFLAFARLYPDFQLLLFFILPVKIKWLALLEWIVYALTFIFGSWLMRVTVLAAVANYLIFFGRDIWRDLKHGHRRMEFQSRTIVGAAKRPVFHQCRVCGINSDQQPRMQFRYCSQCEGEVCYCPEHLHDHEHVGAERGQESEVGGQG